jgi:hypothetical protein
MGLGCIETRRRATVTEWGGAEKIRKFGVPVRKLVSFEGH